MKIATVLLAVFTAGVSFAQSYKLTTMITPSAYQPLGEGASVLAMPWGVEENPYSYIHLPGDTMSFFGVKYPLDTIGVSYFGNLKFENATSAIILDGYFTFLDSISPQAVVKYQVTGEKGNRTIVIDWQNIGMPYCPPEVKVNFQIGLSQKDGSFIINYGESNPVCDSAFGGGTGPYVGIFRSKRDFSVFYKIFWLSGDPLAPKTVSSTLPMLAGPPISGLSYSFSTPQAVVNSGPRHTLLRYSLDGDRIKVTYSASPRMRTLNVFDVLGKTVSELSIAPHTNEIRLPELVRGTYFIRLEEESAIIFGQ